MTRTLRDAGGAMHDAAQAKLRAAMAAADGLSPQSHARVTHVIERYTQLDERETAAYHAICSQVSDASVASFEASVREAVSRSKARRDAACGCVDALRTQTRELQDELERKTAEFHDLISRLKNVTKDKVREKYELRERFTQACTETSRLEDALTTTRAEAERSRRAVDEQAQQARSLQAQLRREEKAVAAMRAKLSACLSSASQLEHDVEAAEQRTRDAEARLARQTARYDAVEEATARLVDERLPTQEETLRRAQRLCDGMDAKIEAARTRRTRAGHLLLDYYTDLRKMDGFCRASNAVIVGDCIKAVVHCGTV